MKVGQLKSGMSHLLPFLLLLLVCHVSSQGTSPAPVYRDPLPTANIPVGVGETPDISILKKDFGAFGEYLGNDLKETFTKCGKQTVKSLNPQFDGGSNVEFQIVCEPHPNRVIVTRDGTPMNYGTFKRDLKQECEMFTCSEDDYPAKGTQIGKMDILAYVAAPPAPSSPPPPQTTNSKTSSNASNKNIDNVSVISAVPERAETSVCKSKKPGYSEKASGSILFANEAKCYKMHSNLQKTLETEKFTQIPRWLQKGESVRNIRPFFFHGQLKAFDGRTPYMFKSTKSMNSLQYKECNTACDSGQVVKVMMKASAYVMTIAFDSKACTSFRICINPENFEVDDVIPTCLQEIDVIVESGIVIWPNKGRASLIELRSPHHDTARPVLIEFGFGVGKDQDQTADFYIGNVHREIVTSSTKGYTESTAQKLAFFFPAENCLKEKAGIFSRYIQHAKTLTSKTPIVGKTYDDVKLIPITAPTEEVFTTTTMETPINFVHTTTPAAIRVVPEGAKLADGESTFDTHQGSKAAYVSGKWWTWGIYLGFVIGTLLTLGIGGGVFYLLRRTIFGIWYRGMYKRYGCDVSGTTGGLTGVGFGNTVTGDVTVQGTTGGTTAGGTTGTSTMGTTGGGTSTTATETSSLLDKTGGTKSIAM